VGKSSGAFMLSVAAGRLTEVAQIEDGLRALYRPDVA
jgi:hypothetical protein